MNRSTVRTRSTFVPARPIIVSICGPSNAGKSQLAKAVAVAVGEHCCARIPTDYFLNLPSAPGPCTPTPITYDWALLDQIVDQPLGTTVTTPDVDFDRLVRRAPAGGLAFVVRPILVTDAFVPHPAATVRIRLTASASVRRARIIARDARWGARVVERWDLLEHTWDDVASRSDHWDLRLSGEEPIEDNAALIAELVGLLVHRGTPASL